MYARKELRREIALGCAIVAIAFASMFVACGADDASNAADAAAADASSSPEGTTSSDASTDADAGAPGAICSSSDPDRLFWNDFEDGEYFNDASTDPAKDFIVSNPASFAVVGKSVMSDTHDGARVLRGNFWQERVNDAGVIIPVYDPVALDAGIQISGSKAVRYELDLQSLGISQSPSTDAGAPTPAPGEAYVSFWIWYDADFSYDSTSGPQQTKLFYAFGPEHTEWVQTDGTRVEMNEVNLGAWPLYTFLDPLALTGKWTHIEWYFKEETKPVFYEYGAFSNGTFLSSSCAGLTDYTMAFPVVDAGTVTCLTGAQALAQNSKDGTYVMKVDGKAIYNQAQMPWNGRFGQITFPAFHGGGGEPIANAGWAVDDVCVRRTAPPGF